ncbi:MAG: hypothetical protein MHM6MM_007599, partial [Cercozoa sp. M6MM]
MEELKQVLEGGMAETLQTLVIHSLHFWSTEESTQLTFNNVNVLAQVLASTPCSLIRLELNIGLAEATFADSVEKLAALLKKCQLLE